MSYPPTSPTPTVPPVSLSNTTADLRDLPPSCKFVYYVLDEQGPLTRAELEAETRLPRDTVLYALRQLRGAGFVTRHPLPTSSNQTEYAITRSR